MSLKISRVLHAGYIVESSDARIIFDPIFENPFSVNCYAFPEIQFDIEAIRNQKFDAVFISHYHDDHCSFESLKLLNRDTPLYMYCIYDEMFLLLQQLGFNRVYPLALGQAVDVGCIKVKPVRALDADVDVMFHIQSGGLNILNVVDSWIDDTILQQLSLTKWDLILWPFQLMREIEVLAPRRFSTTEISLPAEWREQLAKLSPKSLVPSSCQFKFENWSWLNHAFFPMTYRKFHDAVSTLLPKTRQFRLNPGNSLLLGSDVCEYSDSLEWITPVGNQDADYTFEPERKVPSTSEVAKHLDGLSTEQIRKVLKFCEEELPRIYSVMGPSHELYFNKTRLWRLSLFDDLGSPTHCIYRLDGEKLETVISSDDLTAEWVTEIPMVKLYGAIENGESLTSLYIRINDTVFDDEIEKQLGETDLLEDPLLRCLYAGKFASFQKTQLRRITDRQNR